MPKNLFGNVTLSKLLAQQGPIQMPPQQYFTPQQQQQEPPQAPPMMSRPLSPRSPTGSDREFKDLADFVGSGVKSYQAGVDERMSGAPPMETDPRKIMFEAKDGPMQGIPGGYGEPKPSALDKYIADQFSANPAAEGPSLSGGFDMAKLGQEAQSRMKQQNDFRQQFEGTPELDQLIAKAQGDLATAKSERKKPGLGEFLTLALMNLGNRDHRNNADMVLGTGEQREKEGRLEALLTQLEGGRANAKMGGRRQMQAFQQRESQNENDRRMQTAEIMRKQQNEDRDFQFKSNKQGVDLMRALAGQEAQIQGASLDEKTRKAAMDRRAKLMQALQLDPGGLETIIQNQRQQQAPKDDRQSRLFGDFIGGGGYA